MPPVDSSVILEQIVEIGKITDEIVTAFEELVRNEPSVVKCFQDTLSYRAQSTVFPEAQGYDDGLPRVLACLLQLMPLEPAMEPEFDDTAVVDKALIDAFPIAVHRVAMNFPPALVTAKRHADEAQIPMSKLLRKLLQFYVDNKDTYLLPY